MSGSKLEVLGRSEANWIIRFTAGELKPGKTETKPEDDRDADSDEDLVDPDDPKTKAIEKMRLLRDRDTKKEMALKEKLISEALQEIAEMEDSLKAASQIEVQHKGQDQWERFAPESGDQSGKDALELGTGMGSVAKARQGDTELDVKDPAFLKATTAFWNLQKLVKTKLAGVKVKRWRIPEDAKPPFDPVQVEEKLFTDEEIAEEIYTPLVRERIIGDTIVPANYSKTQKTLDSSDEYYIKECKEKGRASDGGWAALAKSGIAIGSSIASTVVSGMTAPSSAGQVANVYSPLDKDQAARINDITTGIAAGLTGFVDLVDKVDSYKKGDDVTAVDIIGCLTSITEGIASAAIGVNYDTSGTSNADAEKKAFITACTEATSAVGKVGAAWVKWCKDGRHGSPPWDFTVENFGTALANSLGSVADNPKLDTATCDKWSDASSAINAAFPIFANAIKNKVLQNLLKGNKEAAFKLLGEAGARAGQASFEGLVTNDMGNSATSNAGFDKAVKFQGDLSSQTGKTVDGLEQGTDLLRDRSSKFDDKLGNKKLEARKEQLKKLAEEFAKKKAEEEETATKPEDIEKALEEEEKEFNKALVSLGKEKPKSEQEYKTIANLIAQIEKDEALFNGITAIFGAGIGTANAVVETFASAAGAWVPVLGEAGQVLKLCTNIRAAMQRIEALDQWRESMAEAAEAVSPYQTSIKRFVKSQTKQRNHYCLQAGANAINVVLMAAQLSPLAPAFKVASGVVATTAALEDAIYKFRKQRELKRAWKTTKQAIDPANKDDRKMRLLARKLNPTLAKYTIAYGAVVEEDPVAIAALDRIGLDRETLVNSAGAVKDVKKYLEKLYPDDGSVYVTLDAAGPPGFKAPKPELTPKTWALTFQGFVDGGLASKNPPLITGNLALLTDLEPKIKKLQEEMEPLEEDDPKLADLRKEVRALQDKELKAYAALETAFRSLAPIDGEKKPMQKVKDAALVYADLAGAEVARLQAEIEPAEGEGVNLRKAGRHKILIGGERQKEETK